MSFLLGLFGLSYWGWLFIGMALLAFELLAPFTFFLWLGASALVTALILFVVPDTPWQAQFLIFSVLSVASIILSRRFLVNRQTESEVPNLNRRAEQYVGRVFTLSQSIEQGEGKIKVDDTHWKVSGPRLEKGAEVRITGANGAVFTVEAVAGAAKPFRE
ncbi:NfeD family protein [Candidatus Spongiihabitans sp.]|uniref:NfeD family protein n=1 Tax=Candidatus Spongiihabitans sp. TaxID=3101308 RepID=UPI003C79D679